MQTIFRSSVVMVLAAGLSSGGCATRGFVRTSVADVDTRVQALSRSVDEHRQQARLTDGRLEEVDRTAQSAHGSAQRAQASADAADARAAAAASHAAALEAASRRVVLTVVLTEGEGHLPFGKATLPDAAQARIDALAGRVKADPMGAYFEIEGHTDAIGDRLFNHRLGLDRAESVQRYLYEKHQIPLHRMNVISYGPDKPVAPNTTRDGRARNRRVVIRILT